MQSQKLDYIYLSTSVFTGRTKENLSNFMFISLGVSRTKQINFVIFIHITLNIFKTIQNIDEHNTNYTFLEDRRIRFTDGYTSDELNYYIPVNRVVPINGPHGFRNLRDFRDYPLVRHNEILKEYKK